MLECAARFVSGSYTGMARLTFTYSEAALTSCYEDGDGPTDSSGVAEDQSMACGWRKGGSDRAGRGCGEVGSGEGGGASTADFLARARAIWGEEPEGKALSEIVNESREGWSRAARTLAVGSLPAYWS